MTTISLIYLPTLDFMICRLAESRKAQADLAREYGIYGFCYYHYWFNGKRLLHEPLDDMLKTGVPDFPFMFCWANENWNRKWDGDENHSLIRQNYSNEDDRLHIRWLCEHVLTDKRYIRVNGKPFFAIYRPGLFPDISKTLMTWREEAKQLGVGDLYIGYMQGFGFRQDPAILGFDAAIDFQPDFFDSPKPLSGNLLHRSLHKLKIGSSVYQHNRIIPYEDFVNHQLSIPRPPL